LRKLQGSALLQQGLPETALEEWSQGNVYRPREETTLFVLVLESIEPSTNPTPQQATDTNGEIPEKCPICFETVSDEALCTTLPCEHEFHQECVEAFFRLALYAVHSFHLDLKSCLKMRCDYMWLCFEKCRAEVYLGKHWELPIKRR
jgi:hypothetical protein